MRPSSCAPQHVKRPEIWASIDNRHRVASRLLRRSRQRLPTWRGATGERRRGRRAVYILHSELAPFTLAATSAYTVFGMTIIVDLQRLHQKLSPPRSLPGTIAGVDACVQETKSPRPVSCRWRARAGPAGWCSSASRWRAVHDGADGARRARGLVLRVHSPIKLDIQIFLKLR
ncbi:hypothetical protein D1007_43623 [Hordeum vulgare]|nr:hypothetical protein D1007_43623 [Hordeum vulgare]